MTTLARYQAFCTDDAGNILPSPTVEVRLEATSALASLFSDRAGSSGISNPFTGGSDGLIAFHVTGGAYKITVTSGSIVRTFRYVAIGTAGEYDMNPAAFSANKNGTDQTGIVSATYTNVTWPNELYDVGGFFGSNIWTPPAGKIHLSASMLSLPSTDSPPSVLTPGNYTIIAIVKNGSLPKWQGVGFNSSVLNQGFANVSITDIANGTDTYGVQTYIVTNSGTATVSGLITNTFFMGYWFAS